MKTLIILLCCLFISSTLLADAPVLQTGQTQCYDWISNDATACHNTYGQDGNFQKGLARSYERNNVTSEVYDKTTGLTWQDDAIISDKTFYDAQGYCQQKGSEYRLPSVKELISLVDHNRTEPAIDPIFQHTAIILTADSYWTNDELDLSKAYAVDFQYGSDSIYSKSSHLLVRCVKGTPFSSSNYKRNSTLETVYDVEANLTWQDNDDVIRASNNMPWKEAIDYCEGLQFAGVSDWRLPNINELYMLMDTASGALVIDSVFFYKPDDPYWSSTTVFNSNSDAWLAFYSDFTGPWVSDWLSQKTNNNYVRCIRDGTIEVPGNFPGYLAYDSDWQSINAGVDKIFNHNMGTDVFDALILVTSTHNSSDFMPTNQCYGGCEQANGNQTGYYWYNLTENEITVKRMFGDVDITHVRVQIWDVPPPDFDSTWLPIFLGDSGPLPHNVGGNPENYVVDLQFSILPGIFPPHNMYYGGILHNDGRMEGAYWHSLTNTTVNTMRMKDDTITGFGRGRIWNVPHSSYDTGWRDDSTSFMGLLGNIDTNAFLYLEQRDLAALEGFGINHAALGTLEPDGSYFKKGCNICGDWFLIRDPFDSVAEQMRMRFFQELGSEKKLMSPAIIMYLLQ